MNNRVIITYIVVFFYNFFFLYLSIKNAFFKEFCHKFIGLLKNREIGEALFIILFYLIPVFLIIWVGKKLNRKKKL